MERASKKQRVKRHRLPTLNRRKRAAQRLRGAANGLEDHVMIVAATSGGPTNATDAKAALFPLLQKYAPVGSFAARIVADAEADTYSVEPDKNRLIRGTYDLAKSYEQKGYTSLDALYATARHRRKQSRGTLRIFTLGGIAGAALTFIGAVANVKGIFF